MTKQQEWRKQTEEAKFEAFSLMCKKVSELEQENAELKEINEGYNRNRDRLISMGFPTFKSCKEYSAKLSEAKEIIKKFLLWENDWHTKTESKYELLKQAEAFLKGE